MLHEGQAPERIVLSAMPAVAFARLGVWIQSRSRGRGLQGWPTVSPLSSPPRLKVIANHDVGHVHRQVLLPFCSHNIPKQAEMGARTMYQRTTWNCSSARAFSERS